MPKMCKCEKCGKTMAENQFYTYKDGTKTELCKKCLTLHIENDDPETYLWLLEKMDVPYVPEEWNVLFQRALAKDPDKINGMTVFGRYLSKMRLKKWKDFGWADSEKLQAQNADKAAKTKEQQKAFENELRKQLDDGKISEAEYRTYVSAKTQYEEYEAAPTINPVGEMNLFNEDNFLSEEEIFKDVDLTDEEKLQMALKWGRLYKPAEWVQLELLYNQFLASFDVQGAARLDTLKKICKTSLKMDQAIDNGDIEGYQKLSRVYDSLMKSAKFTEAQRKEEKAGEFDCVGQVVNFAESRKGGGKIPRHDLSVDLDIFDETIRKLKNYYKDFIYNDPTLKEQIENYIKKREIHQEMENDKREAEKLGQDSLEITDQDLIDLHKIDYEQHEQDVQQQEAGDEN